MDAKIKYTFFIVIILLLAAVLLFGQYLSETFTPISLDSPGYLLTSPSASLSR